MSGGVSLGARELFPLWPGVWRQRARLGGWAAHLAGMAMLVLVVGGGYELVGHFNAWRGLSLFDETTVLDRILPVLPWSVVVYNSLYLFYALLLFAHPRNDAGRLELLVVLRTLIVLALVSFCIFLLLPSQLSIRGQLEPYIGAVFGSHADSYSGTALGWMAELHHGLHSIAPPWNTWPSLHVSQSLVLTLALQHHWRAVSRLRPGRRVLLWSAWCGLVLSTLTTKQHFVFDVASGTLAGLWAWRAVALPALRSVAHVAPAVLLRQPAQEVRVASQGHAVDGDASRLIDLAHDA